MSDAGAIDSVGAGLPFIDGCSSLFALPGMERIRDLTLSGMEKCRPEPSEVASASLAALLALHSLTIRKCYDIDKLLPHLRFAPALRSLTIDPPCYALSAIPSPAVLVELLVAAPALTIRLCRGLVISYDQSAYDAIAASLQLQAFATRFAVEIEQE